MPALVNAAVNFFRHPVARRQPARTAMRVLRWQLACRTRDEVEVPWIGGMRLIAQRGMTGLTGNIYYGLHEFHEMAAALHSLRPGDLFADVGANAGAYTVLAAGVAGADVVAFEPGEHAVAALARNIEANGLGDRTTVHRAAVGAMAGAASFTDGDGTMNRLAPDGPVPVPVTTLDETLRQPAVIKIDIEGGELDALRGAQNVLESSALRLVIAESHGAAETALMEDAGFAKYIYDAFTRRFTPFGGESGNAIFVRDIADMQERVRAAGCVPVFGVAI